MSYDQKAFDVVVKDFREFVERFEPHERKKLFRNSMADVHSVVVDWLPDSVILDEVENRNLHDDVLEWYKLSQRLSDADANDLLEELEGRGEYILTSDSEEACRIYEVYKSGKKEEAAEQALKFIRDLVGGIL